MIISNKIYARFFLAAISVSLIASCTRYDPYNPTASGNIYHCDQERQMAISIADQSNKALIQYEGRTIPLQRYEGFNNAYTNNIYTLFIENKRATLEREGAPILINCRPFHYNNSAT